MRNDYAQKYGIDPERFWSRLDDVESGRECWNWPRLRCDGYGQFAPGNSRRSMLAHRVAFGLTHGYEPEAVCHRCDNRACVNPAHLFGGTRSDNNKDMTAKRRHAAHIGTHWTPRGEDHYRAKITADKVLMIREAGSAGEFQRDIALRFGISQTQVQRILSGKAWKHV